MIWIQIEAEKLAAADCCEGHRSRKGDVRETQVRGKRRSDNERIKEQGETI